MASRKRVSATPREGAICGKLSVTKLERSLLSPDRLQREAVITELENSRDPERKRVFINALCYGNSKTKKWAVKMLERMQEEITDDDILRLASFLNIDNVEIKTNVLNVLGSVALNQFTYDILSAELDNEKDETQIHATITILWSVEAEKNRNRSFEKLLTMLSDEEDAVRESALGQLMKYRNLLTDKDISIVLDMLDSDEPETQKTVLEALKFIDKPGKIAYKLISFFDDMENKDPGAIEAAIDVLGSMKRDSTIFGFLNDVENDPRFESFEAELDDAVSSTMRLSPGDAIKRKETTEIERLFELTNAQTVRKLRA